MVDNHLLNVTRARHFPDEDVPLTGHEFLAVTSVGAFPWTIPAALMVAGLLRRRRWRDPREIAWTALAVWAVGVVAIFTVSPFKLPHYSLPAYPALALLAVRWWRDRAAADPRRAIGLHALVLGALALALAAAVWSGGRGVIDAMLAASDVSTRNAQAVGETAPGFRGPCSSPCFGGWPRSSGWPRSPWRRWRGAARPEPRSPSCWRPWSPP